MTGQGDIESSRRGDLIRSAQILPITPASLLKLILAVLFLGPLIAPLFQATYLPLVADSGALARDLLSHYVCPTPAKSYVLLGFPMAVCARCWGATIGLWAAWLLARPPTTVPPEAGGFWLEARKALLVSSLKSHRRWLVLASALAFLLWAAEIRWWPAAPYWLLLLNGAHAGLWAGLFLCSIWPGLPPSARTLLRPS
jgi:hypothetical protein